VSCVGAGACEAVGYSTDYGISTPRAETWDGTRWLLQHVAQPAEGSFYAISCSASTDCEAVGSVTEVWDGTRWAVQRVPDLRNSAASDLGGVSCTSADFCMATGANENFYDYTDTLAEVWNGSRWAVSRTRDPSVKYHENFLNSVSCTSADFCEAVGGYSARRSLAHGGYVIRYVPLAEVWNGTAWAVQRVLSPSPRTDSTLRGVSCTSASDCEAVGDYASGVDTLAFTETWNGTSWVLQHSPGLSAGSDNPAEVQQGTDLLGVSCASPAACEAVGVNGVGGGLETLGEGWNGTGWTVQDTPSLSGLSVLDAVSCISATACEAVGTNTQSDGGDGLALAESWNGTQWVMQK
jgi:hypothetical protein